MMSIAASVLAADDKSTGHAALRQPAQRHGHVRRRGCRPQGRLPGPDADRPRPVPRAAGGRAAQRPARPRAADRAAAGDRRRGRLDHWWLCGPFDMVTDAIEVLRELGVDAGRIHRELFWVGDEPPAEAIHADAPVGAGASLTVILDGRSTTLTLPAGSPCSTAPSGPGPTCRSPARAAFAAPAGRRSSPARRPCAATTPSSSARSTRATS